LKEIIDLIKLRTGKDKVTIVAHSMGGLVTREYLSIFGYNNVNKIILINTPNHGVSGKVKDLCSVFGSKKECEDMSEGSIFLARLNNQKIPETAKIYSIRSVGCPMDNNQIGDGIVTNSSAYLEGAQNFVIKGKCTDSLQTSLHGDVLKPQKYPEMYNLVEKILKE
jgi:triacylglycerol esterase/lipase EstA (alpha/beta hydrolase family)